MAEKNESRRAKAVDHWANTPAVNPAYRGATPNQVARAMLGTSPRKEPHHFKSCV